MLGITNEDILKTIQDYSEHADKIRGKVVTKLDEVANAGTIVDRKELKRIINVFRNFKYMGRDRFEYDY